MRLIYSFAIFGVAVSGLAANRAVISYSSVKPVLDEQFDRLPAELRNTDAAKWTTWSRRQDKAIRTRLQRGDLDSMVNLLLFGTSFTKLPPIRIEGIVEASKAGTLRARVDDLVAGLRSPGDNERLIFLSRRLRSEGIDPEISESPEAGQFIYDNLLRVLQEKKTFADRAAADKSLAGPNAVPAPAVILNQRSELFRDRGVSLDTSIFPNFSIDQALRDLKKHGVLREGQVARVAVIGPGLDFSDKDEELSYDYYPQQTLQPFALYDSLVRLGLARANAVSVSIFDISSRVVDHIQRARERAMKTTGYVIQLPHNAKHQWPAELVAYWRSLGDQVGTEVAPIRPPQIFHNLETRAVRIRPDVVLACQPMDLNIVIQHVNLASKDRFDLVVGTNIFIYYDAFQQSLALENVGAMLKPGGLLLTNDRLPEAPGGSMRQTGVTDVQYDSQNGSIRDAVVWYQKAPLIDTGRAAQ